MRNVARTVFLVAIGALGTCPESRADVATCWVRFGDDPRLKGEAGKKASARIVKAYLESDDRDQDLAFLLKLTKSSEKKGSYSIQRPEKVKGVASYFTVYEITATDVEGIRNAVAEIEAALRANRIFDLKTGKRDGPVKAPLYIKPSDKARESTPPQL